MITAKIFLLDAWYSTDKKFCEKMPTTFPCFVSISDRRVEGGMSGRVISIILYDIDIMPHTESRMVLPSGVTPL